MFEIADHLMDVEMLVPQRLNDEVGLEYFEAWDASGKRMKELDQMINRLRSWINPPFWALTEIAGLENEWLQRNLNQDHRKAMIEAGKLISNMPEAEFLDYLATLKNEEVVGTVSSAHDCVIFRWIQHISGLDTDSYRVEIEYVTLFDGIDCFLVLLPSWAAHISRITTITHSDHREPITAGGLRRKLSAK